MFCKKCGKEIHDDSSFCSYCGTLLNTDFSKLNHHTYIKDIFEYIKNIKIDFWFIKKYYTYICILLITLTLILITPCNSIVGTWKSQQNDSVIIIKSSGEFINHSGFRGLYETEDNNIIFYDQDGDETEEYSYEIISGKLKLYSWDYDETIILKRVDFKMSLLDVFIFLMGLLSTAFIYISNNRKYKQS